MNDKLTGLLGLSRRAGHMTCGFDAVADLLRGGRAVLVLLASDLSPKTEKELRFIGKDKAADIVQIPLDKSAIGRALVLKKPVGVSAVDDRGFAAAMKKHICHDLEEDEAL